MKLSEELKGFLEQAAYALVCVSLDIGSGPETVVVVKSSADLIGGLAEAVTSNGDVRTLPCHGAGWGGVDGFHIARLVRDG